MKKEVKESLKKSLCEGIESISIKGLNLSNLHDLGMMLDAIKDIYKIDMLESQENDEDVEEYIESWAMRDNISAKDKKYLLEMLERIND